MSKKLPEPKPVGRDELIQEDHVLPTTAGEPKEKGEEEPLFPLAESQNVGRKAYQEREQRRLEQDHGDKPQEPSDDAD